MFGRGDLNTDVSLRLTMQHYVFKLRLVATRTCKKVVLLARRESRNCVRRYSQVSLCVDLFNQVVLIDTEWIAVLDQGWRVNFTRYREYAIVSLHHIVRDPRSVHKLA